jgi:hypothetical protein
VFESCICIAFTLLLYCICIPHKYSSPPYLLGVETEAPDDRPAPWILPVLLPPPSLAVAVVGIILFSWGWILFIYKVESRFVFVIAGVTPFSSGVKPHKALNACFNSFFLRVDGIVLFSLTVDNVWYNDL